MQNKTTVTIVDEQDLVEDFNTESDDIERRLYGEQINHDGSCVYVDTAWATGFVNVEGESMD